MQVLSACACRFTDQESPILTRLFRLPNQSVFIRLCGSYDHIFVLKGLSNLNEQWFLQCP
eukprot:2123065-Amphidinium_carterae.1